MKVRSYVAREQDSASLYDLVDNLIRSSLHVALQRRNLVVNEVAPSFTVCADKKIISTVIGGILLTIMNSSISSYIRISAKKYHDVVLVHIRDFNVLGNYEKYDVQPMQFLARRIGGYVGITSHRQFETTVAFSFPNVS